MGSSRLHRARSWTASILFVAPALASGPGTTLGCAQTETARSPESYELRRGRWFTGEGFEARTMWVENGVFRASRPERVDSVIDLGEGFVVPPFGEAHNHWLEPDLVRTYVARHLLDGVFYVRDQANAPWIRRRLEPELNRPTSVDFISANQGFTGPDAHPIEQALLFLQLGVLPREWDVSTLNGEVVMVVRDTEQVEQKWPLFLADRPDFVKVFLLYSEQYAQRLSDPNRTAAERGMDPALVPEIVRRAHAQGLKVSAHVWTAADFRTALAAGVDMMAHIPGEGYDRDLGPEAFRLTDADAELAEQRGVSLVTTVTELARGRRGRVRHGGAFDPESQAAEAARGTAPDRQRSVPPHRGRRGAASLHPGRVHEPGTVAHLVRDDPAIDLPGPEDRSARGRLRGQSARAPRAIPSRTSPTPHESMCA